MKWRIYYQDREYARVQGDPCLGIVEAETKADAERIGARHGLGALGGMVGGLWAVREDQAASMVNLNRRTES